MIPDLPDVFLNVVSDGRISVADMGAYVLLYMRADDTGRIEASLAELTDIIRLSRRTSLETLRRLHAAGVIVYRPTDTRFIGSVVELIGVPRIPMDHQATKYPDDSPEQGCFEDGMPDNLQGEPIRNKKGLKSKRDTESTSKGGGCGRGKRRYAEDSPEYLLAAGMHKAIVKAVDPGHKEPDLQVWADQMRLLIERDGRSLTEVGAVLRWLYYGGDADAEFWRKVVLSPRKLRDKFSNLVAKMPASARQAAQPKRPSVPCPVCHGSAWVLEHESDTAKPCTADGCEKGRVYE